MTADGSCHVKIEFEKGPDVLVPLDLDPVVNPIVAWVILVGIGWQINF